MGLGGARGKAVRYPANDMAGMWRSQGGAIHRKR